MMATLSSFHSFPILPPELRLQIWSNLLPPPRIIQVTSSPAQSDRLVSLTKAPILLSICHESRSFILSTYTHILPPTPPSPASLHSSTQTIPISLSHDTLYLTLPCISSNQLHQTPAHIPIITTILTLLPLLPIHRLALDFRIWDLLCHHNLITMLAYMPQLRHVQMVVEYGRDFEGELGFLDVPVWRGDLRLPATRAQSEILEKRREEEIVGRKDVEVKCVILTKGGEMA